MTWLVHTRAGLPGVAEVFGCEGSSTATLMFSISVVDFMYLFFIKKEEEERRREQERRGEGEGEVKTRKIKGIKVDTEGCFQ